MIRKLFKILKAAIVGAVWTVVFVYAARIIMISIWNFDILNMRDWQVINTFWESGGKIKTGRDYLLSACCWRLFRCGSGAGAFSTVSALSKSCSFRLPGITTV